MRKDHHNQLRLSPARVEHPHARELEAISDVLDANPTLASLIAQDLVGPERSADRGRQGLTGAQVLRIALLKQMEGFSYEELAFHLADSLTYRRFCRIGIGDRVRKASALQDNVRRIRPATWEAVNRVIVDHARAEGVERGDKVRIDATVTATNIHPPDDAAQLWDAVRVITRLLDQVTNAGFSVSYARRTKRAKRRRMDVMNAKKPGSRRRAYRDLIRVTEEVLGFADAAVNALPDCDPVAIGFATELAHFAELGRRVVDQTRRRVLDGEKVAAADKVVSIFEPHTDIIVKGRRDVQYGHKMFLTAGASSLVVDLFVADGNPADATLVETMLDRAHDALGRVPRQAALDGGFASKANLAAAKERGVKDVCFSKGRGLEITDMVRSTWVYKRLRRFRAGVEGAISFLKRAFGFDRCTWRGLAGFKAYAWASVVSCNLLIIARHMLE